MGNGKVLRLFIIYAWQHYELYEQLVSSLDSMSDFYWINNSVPRENTRSWVNCSKVDIQNYLTGRIKKSDYILIIMSENIAREWIHFEVLAARSLGKPIIGVKSNAFSSDYLSVVQPDLIISPDKESIVNTLKTIAVKESL